MFNDWLWDIQNNYNIQTFEVYPVSCKQKFIKADPYLYSDLQNHIFHLSVSSSFNLNRKYHVIVCFRRCAAVMSCVYAAYVFTSVPPRLDSDHSLSAPVKTFNLCFRKILNSKILWAKCTVITHVFMVCVIKYQFKWLLFTSWSVSL